MRTFGRSFKQLLAASFCFGVLAVLVAMPTIAGKDDRVGFIYHDYSSDGILLKPLFSPTLVVEQTQGAELQRGQYLYCEANNKVQYIKGIEDGVEKEFYIYSPILICGDGDEKFVFDVKKVELQ